MEEKSMVDTPNNILNEIRGKEINPKEHISMSKNQRKKMIRRQKMKEKRKAKKIQKKKRKREERQEGIVKPPKEKKPPLAIEFGPHRIAIDLSFDELMTEREIISLSTQISWCYGKNRRANKAALLYFTGFHGRTKDRMNGIEGFENWKNVTFTNSSLKEMFDLDDIVYLTSESPNELKELNESKVYVVGGIVDHNRLKGLTYSNAQKEGFSTGYLPIGKYFNVSGRKVLTVNHVMEILLQFYEVKDWEQAMENVLPRRKKVVKVSDIKEKEEKDNEKEEEKEEEEKEDSKTKDKKKIKTKESEQFVKIENDTET